MSDHSGGLQPGDSEILRKLHDELFDWFWAGRIVRRQWFYWLSIVMVYGADLAAALAGLGLGGPAAAYLKGDVKAANLVIAAPDGIGWSAHFALSLAAVLVWLVLRIVSSNEDIASRAIKAREFAVTMRTQWIELERALRDPQPLPGILKVQQIVDRKVQDAAASAKDILPWTRLPPHADLEREMAKRQMAGYIRVRYMAAWKAVPNQEVPDDE